MSAVAEHVDGTRAVDTLPRCVRLGGYKRRQRCAFLIVPLSSPPAGLQNPCFVARAPSQADILSFGLLYHGSERSRIRLSLRPIIRALKLVQAHRVIPIFGCIARARNAPLPVVGLCHVGQAAFTGIRCVSSLTDWGSRTRLESNVETGRRP